MSVIMTALFLDLPSTGSSSAAKLPMIAITTSSSMSVKAERQGRGEQQRREGAKGGEWRLEGGAAM